MKYMLTLDLSVIPAADLPKVLEAEAALIRQSALTSHTLTLHGKSVGYTTLQSSTKPPQSLQDSLKALLDTSAAKEPQNPVEALLDALFPAAAHLSPLTKTLQSLAESMSDQGSRLEAVKALSKAKAKAEGLPDIEVVYQVFSREEGVGVYSLPVVATRKRDGALQVLTKAGIYTIDEEVYLTAKAAITGYFATAREEAKVCLAVGKETEAAKHILATADKLEKTLLEEATKAGY